MRIIKISLPKLYVRMLWSLMTAYIQKDLVDDVDAGHMFRFINKFAKLYDDAKDGKTITMLLAQNDAELIWNIVNQACLTGKEDGIVTDVQQVLILNEILTELAIKIDTNLGGL